MFGPLRLIKGHYLIARRNGIAASRMVSTRLHKKEAGNGDHFPNWQGNRGPPRFAAMLADAPRNFIPVVIPTFSCGSMHARERRILLVEDNPDDEKVTLRTLKTMGIANSIVVARDGEEALDLLIGARAMDFGLVLLDLLLPKVHGLRVLARIRGNARTRLVPVIILTSSKAEGDIVKSCALGASSYIVKPVDFGKFIAEVSSLGVYWLVLRESPPSTANVAGHA